MPFGTALFKFADQISNYVTPNFPMSVYIVDVTGYPMADALILQIPHEVKYSYKPLINEYYTRGGIVQEHWGDDLDTLAVKGATSNFIHQDCGLSRTKARETPSYQRFMDTIDVFKNNGCLYDPRGFIIDRASRGNPAASVGGKVVITYSAGIFEGFFTEFNYEEDATIPFRFNFDFTYRVQRVILAY